MEAFRGAKGHLLKTVKQCLQCGGAGVTFDCKTWERSIKTCCPTGTVRKSCAGITCACSQCGGSGFVASPE